MEPTADPIIEGTESFIPSIAWFGTFSRRCWFCIDHRAVDDGCASRIHVEVFEITKFMNICEFKVSAGSNSTTDCTVIGNDTVVEECVGGTK
jgi:hypothetical protein